MTMDVEEEAPTSRRKYLAGPSLACDLIWIMSVAVRPSWQSKYPMLTAMFEGREELADRVRNFWPDSRPEICFTEMQILAHHAGMLTETNPERLWAGVEAAVATIPDNPTLQSETPEDREVFWDRLGQLKRSPALLRSYVQILREIWEPIDEMWQAALPSLAETARQAVAQLERGTPFTELIDLSCCQTLRDMVPDINNRLDAGQPLLVVPCFFFGRSLYLEFPGLTLVGVGMQQNDHGARARTATVARQLKAVADPTRLALLHYLVSTPSTVGDLATSFGLAQPTVSMHIKLLRETGLVQGERKGGRLELHADTDAVHAMLSELQGVMGQGSSTSGSERIPATVVEATRSSGPVTS
jgi:DNA-binding transcriptional ArsR family regulator